jgi:DNA-binding SARP family transcriptional activator
MEKLRIETMGGIQVLLDGESIKISRRKAIALLVYLAVTGELHSRESLATLLWPDNTQSRAYANLRQAIWDINRSLGEDWLETSRDSVRITPSEDLWLDFSAFNELLTDIRTHPHPRVAVCEDCLARFQQAADLVHGDFLAGFSLRDSAIFDDWQFFQADELRREVGKIYRQLVAWYLDKKEFEQAIGFARRWLQLDELNEDAHRALMELYVANSQRNAALRQYQSCVDLLKRELGISPEAATTALFETIQRGELQAPQPESEEETIPLTSTNLPVHLNPFIGRIEEHSKLTRLLKDPDIRLLTILAPGGMGKSRLAVEVARTLESHFEHGVFFIPLAPLETPDMILNYIADAIGYVCCEGKPLNQKLLDFFRDKSILLVLDNFEHLLEKSYWIRDLLAAAPNLKVLTTSRSPLNIRVENRFHLAGMKFPTGGTNGEVISTYTSVKLFLQSARRARPTFRPTEEDWPHIGEICRLVGGMPLGIEMASSWLEMLSLPEIVTEIQAGLEFFETSLSDIPERQHSLYTIFDHAWKMLTDEERVLFPQIAIFRGGFTREAAEKIIGVSLRQLVGFANRSLLTRTPDDRFEIHELLRQYGFEKLQKEPEIYRQVKTRYAEYFCKKMGDWHQALISGRQQQALMEIDTDFENVRHAWEISAWLKRLDLLETAHNGLVLYLNRRVRYEEGVSLCELAAEHISDDSPEGVRLNIWLHGNLASFYYYQGRIDQVPDHIQELEALVDRLEPDQSRDDKMAMAFALYIKGLDLDRKGKFSTAYNTIYQQSLKLFQELGEEWWSARIYRFVAIASWVDEDLDAAYNHYQEALKISRKLNDHYGLAVTLERLGWFAAYGKGTLEKAENFLQESSQIVMKLDDPNSYRRHLYCLEQIANIYGRFDEVLELRHKHLRVLENLGDQFGIAELYMLFGEAYHHIGDYAVAEIKGRKGFEYLSERGSTYYQAWSRWFLGLTMIAQEDYQQAENLLSQAITINRDTNNQAHFAGNVAAVMRVDIAKDDLESASNLLIEGLNGALIASEPFMMLYLLASAALLVAKLDDHKKALDIYSLVHSWEFVANSQWFTDVYRKPILALTGNAKIPALNRQPKETLWQMAESLLKEMA